MNACLRLSDSATICCWETFYASRAIDFDSLKLKTGDLLLGAANPSGRTPGLNTIGTCRWDHVGMVIVHEGTTFVVDSGSTRYYPFCVRPLHFSQYASLEAWSKQASGPQMYKLSQFIEAQGRGPLEHTSPPWYYERLGIRPLRSPLSDEQIQRLHAALDALSNVPYEQNAGEMTAGAVDLCGCVGLFKSNKEARDSLFCSELVAAAYMDAGLLPPASVLPANEYVPSDFARDHGGNLSSLCCCCCFSWCCARTFGVGELRDTEGLPIFGPEVLLRTHAPPASVMASRVAPDDSAMY